MQSYNDFTSYKMPLKLPDQLRQQPLAFSPNTSETESVARRAAEQLGFSDVMPFGSEAEMRNHFKRANFFNKTDAMLRNFSKQLNESGVQLDYTQLDDFLFGEYKFGYLEYEDVHEQEMFLGIHFDLSEGLEYTCYYNQ